MSEPFYAPRFIVKIAGVTLGADITDQVTGLSYESNLDIADMFVLSIRNADNRVLDSALFDLGKQIEIYMGYGDDLEPMILGEVTALEPSFPESGAPTVRIVGYDKSYRMRHNSPDRSAFVWANDSAIAAQIAAENLLIPIVDPSPIFHQRPLLASGSDMALLQERAQANFFEVYVRWDKLYFRFPRPQTEILVLEWGRNLSSFSPRISSATMAGLQVIRGYSEELASTIIGIATAIDVNADNLLEKLGSSAISLLTSLGRRLIYRGKLESPVDAMVLAKSMLQEILEGLYEGAGSCIGLPKLRAGQFVNIEGVGKRFSGTYRLRKVTHSIGSSGYETAFEVSQRGSSTILSAIRKFMDSEVPPDKSRRFYGVAVGKVTNNKELQAVPPELPLGRVKLLFPWLSDKVESPWARVATPMAGKDCGMYFLPSIGDEVLVAFEHGDLSKPVVIGSLWNPAQMPPETNPDGANRKRVIKSASGHKITFDDTPKLGKVVVEDASGSKITLDGDGSVTISASTTLTLKANTKITLSAPSVEVE